MTSDVFMIYGYSNSFSKGRRKRQSKNFLYNLSVLHLRVWPITPVRTMARKKRSRAAKVRGYRISSLGGHRRRKQRRKKKINIVLYYEIIRIVFCFLNQKRTILLHFMEVLYQKDRKWAKIWKNMPFVLWLPWQRGWGNNISIMTSNDLQ